MKKNIVMIVCSAVVVVAIALALLFVFSGKGQAPQAETPVLSGIWVVAANYTNDVPVFTQSQYMVFTEDRATMYVGDTQTPYAESSYSVNEAYQLLLPDISRQYKLDKKTDNCVRLYDSTTTYMLLIRNSRAACETEPVKAESLQGKWNVRMKGDLMNSGEVMEFSGASLQYYKADSAEPIVTDYAVSDAGALIIQKMGLTMYCYAVSENTVVFVEEGGIVWELTK